MYAVVGATGNTGRAVVKELKALGENPVCIVRNADKAKEVLGADTKTTVAELDDRAALEKALQGVKRVFIVTGHNPKSDVQQINVIEAAKAAGAEYIVKVSGRRDVLGPNVDSVNGQAHYKIEEHLKKSATPVRLARACCASRTSTTASSTPSAARARRSASSPR